MQMSNPKGLRKESASPCFTASPDEAATPRQKHAALIRASLSKCDPGMLALADGCKATFGARMDGLTLPHADGTVGGAGKFAPDSDWWQHWPEGQR